jgi:hypothetical protein
MGRARAYWRILRHSSRRELGILEPLPRTDLMVIDRVVGFASKDTNKVGGDRSSLRAGRHYFPT